MDQPGDVRDDRSEEGLVDFRAAGEQVKGEFHCSSCGYGVTVYRTLPPCPMCSGTAWEAAAWSPFARARDASPTIPA